MPKNIIQINYIAGSVKEFDKFADLIQSLNLPARLNHIKEVSMLIQEVSKSHSRLMVGQEKKKGFDIFSAVKQMVTSELDIPAIALFSKDSGLTIEEAMGKGLNDYVDISNEGHLRLVLQRELKYLMQMMTHADDINVSALDFTGLNSRLHFIDYLEQKIVERVNADTCSAVLYLQLDNFSWINESLGIELGDVFLKKTATIIITMLEDSDVAARYQGGSFIMLVTSENLEKLHAKTDMLRETIGTAISELGEKNISSSCSIGIKVLDNVDELVNDIISNAFKASDSAKANGGDSVRLFHRGKKVEVIEQSGFNWEKRLKEAFDNDLFRLFFQPIVSLRGDTKPRYEVLLRLLDEQGNITSPGTFLPFAERAGLMAALDRRVITQAFEKVYEESQIDHEMEVFIKLSGKSLDDNTIAGWITNTLNDFDIKNENIVFEITESLALSHLPQTRRLVDSLKQMNCKIAIDHFGTRLKSFKLFDLVDIDYIKIDGSLVSQLQNNKSHQVIVKKIFKMANKAGIQTVAATVQDANTLPIIWQHGFHFVQGYFLQIPDEQMGYDFSNLLI